MFLYSTCFNHCSILQKYSWWTSKVDQRNLNRSGMAVHTALVDQCCRGQLAQWIRLQRHRSSNDYSAGHRGFPTSHQKLNSRSSSVVATFLIAVHPQSVRCKHCQATEHVHCSFLFRRTTGWWTQHRSAFYRNSQMFRKDCPRKFESIACFVCVELFGKICNHRYILRLSGE